MPLITDYFGKASIDSDTSVATTVKTTRLIGGTVLEAFDLSKFSDDTPVFVVTYKKTIDPVTSEVSVTNLVSWKGLVNAIANTITNLTLAPGYSDTGNAIGDFIECIPTSYWGNSLIDGLMQSINPDGTLKDSIVTTPKLAGASVDGTKLSTGNTQFFTYNGTAQDITSATHVDMSTNNATSVVPSWATTAFVTLAITRTAVVSAATEYEIRMVIGSDVSTIITAIHPAVSNESYNEILVTQFTITSTGSQTVKAQCRRLSGSGAVRLATTTKFNYRIDYR